MSENISQIIKFRFSKPLTFIAFTNLSRNFIITEKIQNITTARQNYVVFFLKVVNPILSFFYDNNNYIDILVYGNLGKLFYHPNISKFNYLPSYLIFWSFLITEKNDKLQEDFILFYL